MKRKQYKNISSSNKDLREHPPKRKGPFINTEKHKNLKLWDSNDLENWIRYYLTRNRYCSALEKYDARVEELEKGRKRAINIIELDNWIKNSLPISLNKSIRGLSKLELERVFIWKISRGKFRPLRKLILSNKDSLIKEVTLRGFKIALSAKNSKDIKTCLNVFCELKGIGPATASLLASLINPNFFPFMSDEAIIACGLPREYKMKNYLEFCKRMQNKSKVLKELNANQVQNALWSFYCFP
eukprot:snap_masked-scaffold_13-processed-gene-6.32-mRNA-1 protein AED:1.00 eAED:1.00 QI:0/0/0/0/1/1/2/0/241